MPVYGRREQHPALIPYIITMVLVLLMVILGFIAVFVPWAWKDLAPGSRAWAYPFKTCIVNTFSTVNEQTCLDNDFIEGPKGAPVTQGDQTCESFVLTTIAFVFISVIGGVLTLIAMLFLLYRLYTRPLIFAIIIEIVLVILLAACIIAWALWIAFMERTCKPNTIFPIQTYSYGFVQYIFATACMMGAVVMGLYALFKVKSFKPNLEYGKDFDEYGYIPAQEYPMYPISAEPAAPATGAGEYYYPPAGAVPIPMQTPVGAAQAFY